MSIPTLTALPLFSKKYPSFPIGGMRHKVFLSGTNGLAESGAIVRDGRKILINEEKFFEWLQSGKAA